MKQLALISTILLAACSAQNEQVSQYRPEQVVRLSDSAFGCESLMQLGVAAEHYNKGEFSAWGAALRGPSCFTGASASGDWTVYQTDGAAVQVGKSTLAQYNASKDNGVYDPLRQYWVPESQITAQ